MAQSVKHLPTMQETRVQSLGWIVPKLRGLKHYLRVSVDQETKHDLTGSSGVDSFTGCSQGGCQDCLGDCWGAIKELSCGCDKISSPFSSGCVNLCIGQFICGSWLPSEQARKTAVEGEQEGSQSLLITSSLLPLSAGWKEVPRSSPHSRWD